MQKENDGNEPHALLGDIEKLKKVAEILETIGQAVLPTVVDEATSPNAVVQQSNGETMPTKTNVGDEHVNFLPKTLKILQHHNAITSNLEEAIANS